MSEQTGLFPLRLTRRVELRTRDQRLAEAFYGIIMAPSVLRQGEKVAVLDVFAEGFYCETRHGKALLPVNALKPWRTRKAVR